MAIKCHSAYVHYNMFHDRHNCCGGGDNFGSVFNVKYNCGGGTNFWGGLGAGLGMGLGNMLGGLCNWFGGFGMNSMFGGFGMGNMFGGFGDFGFGGFGGFGSPFGGGYYTGWNSALGNLWGTGKKDKKDDVDTNPKDKDYNKINKEYEKDIKNLERLEKNLDLTNEKAVNDYNKKVEELITKYNKEKYKLEDDVDTTANKEHLDNNVKALEGWKREYTPKIETAPPAVAQTDADKKAGVETPTAPPAAESDNGEDKKAEATDWSKITTPEQFAALNSQAKNNITKEKASELIQNLPKNDKGEYIINELDTDKLLLLSKAGVKVQFGENTGTDKGVQQCFIHGNFKIQLKDDGTLEYFTIDNSIHPAEMGLEWTFVPTDDNKACTIKDIKNTSNNDIYISPDYFTRKYNIANGKMTINDSPTASSWQRELDNSDTDKKVINSGGQEIKKYIKIPAGKSISEFIETTEDGKYILKEQ